MPVKPNLELYSLPYHCPKCNEYEGFISIQMLRQHLEIEHSDPTRHGLIRSSEFPSSSQYGSMPISTEMGHYTREATKLEKQLATLKDAENKHRTQWQKVKYTFNQYPRPVLKPTTVCDNIQNSKQADEVLNTSPNITDENIHSLHMTRQPCQPNFPGKLQLNQDKKSEGHKHIDKSYVSSVDQGSNVRADGLSAMASSLNTGNLWTYTNKEVVDLRHLVERLKEQLEFKDTQLKKATDELQSLTSDRLDLQRQVLNLSKGNEDSSVRLSHFEGQLEEKDKHILQKQDEITSMSKFLHELSLKETSARQRLEDYVNLLLERTEKAEARLRKKKKVPTATLR